jgi:hypothetical protein
MIKLSKLLILHTVLLLILNSLETFGQSNTDKILYEFLLERNEVDSNEDSIYIYKASILDKGGCFGVYKFGIRSAHHKAYYFIKENCKIRVIKNNDVSSVLNETSNFLRDKKNITEVEKLKVYKDILDYYENNIDSNRWYIKDEELIKN